MVPRRPGPDRGAGSSNRTLCFFLVIATCIIAFQFGHYVGQGRFRPTHYGPPVRRHEEKASTPEPLPKRTHHQQQRRNPTRAAEKLGGDDDAVTQPEIDEDSIPPATDQATDPPGEKKGVTLDVDEVNDLPLIEPLEENKLGLFLPTMKQDQLREENGERTLGALGLKPLMEGGTRAKCVNRGMQTKCLINYLGVSKNTFTVFSPKSGGGGDASKIPNPIFPADGQTGPLWQYHKYRGHKLKTVSFDKESSSSSRDLCPGGFVPNPTIFLFRMSGHSTYHLWENNLGPFYSTLNDGFDLSGQAKNHHLSQFNDPKKLLIVYVDSKPRTGPKAPHLLDQLLRSFTQNPLLNASRVGLSARDPTTPKTVCFEQAIVGVAATNFPHKGLLYRMLENTVGLKNGPPPLPDQPNAIFISRNHHTVTRGRKIANEAEVVKAINDTLMRETGKPLRYLFMQDLSYTQQVQLSAETNLMFSPHGGGSANCIWMQKGSVMVEFVAPIGKTLLGMYNSMCKKSGVNHLSFLADPDPEDAKVKLDNPRLFSNMVVPVEKILDATKKALAYYYVSYRSAYNKQQNSRK